MGVSWAGTLIRSYGPVHGQNMEKPAPGIPAVWIASDPLYNCPRSCGRTAPSRVEGWQDRPATTTETTLNLRNIDRRLLTILLIVFVQMLGAAMILPILPLYARREFDMSPQTITLLLTTFFAAQFVAGPFLGRLSDRHGRIPVLIVSQIGTALSFLMLALARDPEMLFLARLLDGITGGNIIVAQAYITDITPRERRTEALGYVFAVFGIGFVFGPALGGIVSAAFGPRIPYVVAAAAATLVVVMTWRILEETVTPEKRQAQRARRRSTLGPRRLRSNTVLLLILVTAFMGQFGLGLLQGTFALFGEAVLFDGRSPETTNLGIGLLLAVIGLGQFVTQAFLLRPLLKRLGEYRLIILGNASRMLSSFAYALLSSPWLAGITGLFFAGGVGVMMPSLQSLATGTVEDEARGGVLGLYQSAVSLSTILSTALSGVLFAINPRMPYWLGGLLAALALIPAALLWLRSGQTDETVTAHPVTADQTSQPNAQPSSAKGRLK
jgi:MFS transporter, DHA1 family, tetracycline resistance protein